MKNVLSAVIVLSVLSSFALAGSIVDNTTGKCLFQQSNNAKFGDVCCSFIFDADTLNGLNLTQLLQYFIDNYNFNGSVYDDSYLNTQIDNLYALYGGVSSNASDQYSHFVFLIVKH